MTGPTGRTRRLEAARLNLELAARLGGEIRSSRRRRRWTQGRLAAEVGVSQATISRIERGRGGRRTLDDWQALALALERTLRVDLANDPYREPADAGHLAIQELILRLARRAGLTGRFELALRPGPGAGSTDVGIRDDARRLMLLVECWNTIADIGAAARATTRKTHEAEGVAIALGAGRPHRVASCWVVRATARNRALVARYPEVFASRFPGSSAGWVAALVRGMTPPPEPGLVWCDVGATRVFAHRRRQTDSRRTEPRRTEPPSG